MSNKTVLKQHFKLKSCCQLAVCESLEKCCTGTLSACAMYNVINRIKFKLKNFIFHQELSEQITNLQRQLNTSESALLQEKTAHSNTQEELEDLKKQMEVLKEEVQTEKEDLKAQRASDKQTKDAENKAKMEVWCLDFN